MTVLFRVYTTLQVLIESSATCGIRNKYMSGLSGTLQPEWT
jgi:hypothetical protein